MTNLHPPLKRRRQREILSRIAHANDHATWADLVATIRNNAKNGSITTIKPLHIPISAGTAVHVAEHTVWLDQEKITVAAYTGFIDQVYVNNSHTFYAVISPDRAGISVVPADLITVIT